MKPQNKYLLKLNRYVCLFLQIKYNFQKKKNVYWYWSTIYPTTNAYNRYINLLIFENIFVNNKL